MFPISRFDLTTMAPEGPPDDKCHRDQKLAYLREDAAWQAERLDAVNARVARLLTELRLRVEAGALELPAGEFANLEAYAMSLREDVYCALVDLGRDDGVEAAHANLNSWSQQALTLLEELSDLTTRP